MSVLEVVRRRACDAKGVPLDWERCRTCGSTGRVLPPDEAGGPMAFGPAYRETYEAIVRDDAAALGDVPPSSEVMRERRATCPRCGGHGSLRAAALAGRLAWLAAEASYPGDVVGVRMRDGRMHVVLDPAKYGEGADVNADAEPARCEGCGHPALDGSWSGDLEAAQRHLDVTPGLAVDAGAELTAQAMVCLRSGQEPLWGAKGMPVHWSPCDEGCHHLGPFGVVHHHRGPVQPNPSAEEVEAARMVIPRAGAVQASWRDVDVRFVNGWPHDLRPENLALRCVRCEAINTMGGGRMMDPRTQEQVDRALVSHARNGYPTRAARVSGTVGEAWASGQAPPPVPRSPTERLLAAMRSGWQRWTTVARKANLSNKDARAAFRRLEEAGQAEASSDGTAWRLAGVDR
jgi:hypothetical protein